MEPWIANAVGELHINKITHIELAKKLGWTSQYLSAIFNGKRAPKGAQNKIEQAIKELIETQKH